MQAGIIGAIGVAVPAISLLSIIHYSQLASQRSQSLLNLTHVGASAAVTASPSTSPSASPSPGPTPTPTVEATPSPTPTSTIASVLGAIPSNPPSSSPTGRGAAQFAYDTTHHVAVLFGGFGDADGNTWTWDGKVWTVQPPALSPPSRRGGILIEDPLRHQLLLFGGWALDSTYLADTWTWDGSRWTQRSSARSPSPRAFASAAFDGRRGNIVLFGGYDEKAFLTDMWTWDGTQWATKPAPAGTPALSQVGMAYEKANDTLVVVGERTQSTTIFMGLQTWIDDGKTWRQLTGGGTPCDHHYGGAAQDLSTDAIVIFGGQCGNPGELATWKGNAWQLLRPVVAPEPRGQEAGRPALTYDPEHHLMLLFGGVDNTGTPTPYSDLWGWNGSAWTRLS